MVGVLLSVGFSINTNYIFGSGRSKSKKVITKVSSAVEYLGLSAKGAGFCALWEIESRTISVFNNDIK